MLLQEALAAEVLGALGETSAGKIELLQAQARQVFRSAVRAS